MALQRLLWRGCYELLARYVTAPGWRFMNYGYAVIDPADPTPRVPSDDPDRLCKQLYLRALNGADLFGCDVLEVGSGRGGGARYIAGRLGARSVTGLDFSSRAVALCNRDPRQPGLSFVRGDAAALPFPDASFDAVVNVESSHCYDDVLTFLSEVARVLRPNGRFFFADLRSAQGADLLRSQLQAGGLHLLDVSDITSNVVAALDADNARKVRLIEDWIPPPFRGAIRVFAGIEGTVNHRRLKNRSWRYLAAQFRKPESGPGS